MPQTQQPNSRAVFKESVTFSSLQAHHVMDRCFEKLNRSLFSISVILQITCDEEKIDQVNDVIKDYFIDGEKDLMLQIAQMKKILDDNGVEKLAGYTRPRVFELELYSPRMKKFLVLVELLDQLIRLIDTVWFASELTDKQKKVAGIQWRQRLIKLSGRIINIEKRARNDAASQGKKEEVEAAAPADTSDTDEEILAAVKEAENETTEIKAIKAPVKKVKKDTKKETEPSLEPDSEPEPKLATA